MALTLFGFRFKAFGGPNELQLFATNRKEAERCASLAIAEAQRIETKYSRYRSDSVVSQINKAAGLEPVVVDPETAALLGYADKCFEQSDGLFDITSGVLRRVWNYSEPKLPDPGALEQVLELIGWGSVEWDSLSIRLPRVGMELDFGGFGKEYAVDRVSGLLLDQGVESALINFGGDVRVLGPHPDGTAWRVGVAHPREERAILAAVALKRGSLTTSGDYERFIEVNGVRYCHILNPQTGYPVNELQAVSVVADSCLVGGSFSTISMLLGARDGVMALEESSLGYLVVTAGGEIETNLKGLADAEERETAVWLERGSEQRV